MPTYVYQVINDDGSEGETFEVCQTMSEEPLTKHPRNGKPVRRVIQPPTIPGQWSHHAIKQRLSNDNLQRLGFTKYERAGKGYFEKKAGSGPQTLGASED